MNDDHLYRDPDYPWDAFFSHKDQEYWAGGTGVPG